ncbi:MAG TPA: DnaJ C-terminal domain-containing protein, partial [Clostridia bacterium]|nr:DnaJ C-terminal domain-containing protein [Clostridia bacterium]
VMQTTVCDKCQGKGVIIENPCPECHGSGKVRKTRKIHVKVPPGVDNGSRLRLNGEGGAGEYGGPPGDLYVFIRVKPHKVFKREGSNIFTDMQISFVQATLGDEVVVDTLDGKVKLKIPEGTQSGTTFRMRGKGVPLLGRYGRRGDQLVNIQVVTPQKLSSKQKELLLEFAELGGDQVAAQEGKGFFRKVKDAFMG